MTLSSDDEYGGDFPSFSQDDLDAIDALSVPPPPPAAINPPTPTTMPPPSLSLLARFRANRPLSVTDLTSPIWCEYQWSYSLMGKRYLPLRLRPKKLELPSGREIKVDQERAEVGDKILRAGGEVHKKLELEIHPVQVQVRTQSDEEAMALKLVNMFQGVRALLEQGCTREFPVFGFLHNQHITGIIDEIRRTPLSSSPSAQRTILSFFSLSPSRPTRARPTHVLRVSDAKSRLTPSVPPPESTTALAARLQLMLYKSLLDPFISLSEPAFGFSAYFLSIGLDENRVFTDDFLASLYMLVEDGSWDRAVSGARCLADLVKAWPAAVRQLGADGTEDTMEIIYRLQPKRIKRKRKPHLPTHISPAPTLPVVTEKSPIRATRSPSPDPDAEHPRSMPGAFDGTSDASFSPSSEDSDSADDQVMQMVMQESLRDARAGEEVEAQGTVESALRTPTAGRTVPVRTAVPPDTPDDDALILGTQTFTHSQAQLDVHIDDMLRMWNGERELRGVSVEDAGRCWRCPYEDGCEWREVKARELLQVKPGANGHA